MPKGDRVPSMPVTTCPGCGMALPPAKAWSDLTVAEHGWRHRQAEHIGRTVRGRPDTRSDLEQMVTAADGYIGALEHQTVQLRRRLADVTDRCDDLERQLDDLNRKGA